MCVCVVSGMRLPGMIYIRVNFFVFQSEREAGVSAVIFVGVYNARNGTGVCYHVSVCDY